MLMVEIKPATTDAEEDAEELTLVAVETVAQTLKELDCCFAPLVPANFFLYSMTKYRTDVI